MFLSKEAEHEWGQPQFQAFNYCYFYHVSQHVIQTQKVPCSVWWAEAYLQCKAPISLSDGLGNGTSLKARQSQEGLRLGLSFSCTAFTQETSSCFIGNQNWPFSLNLTKLFLWFHQSAASHWPHTREALHVAHRWWRVTGLDGEGHMTKCLKWEQVGVYFPFCIAEWAVFIYHLCQK